HVADSGKSASDSFQSFLDGTGDVAVTYESEVERAWIFGHSVERVVPRSTVLVEHPAIVVTKNIKKHRVREVAEGLLQFLWSAEAQKQLAFCGLRPVDEAIAAEARKRFPVPVDLWTIADLGGWDSAVRNVLVPAGLAR